MTRKIVHGVTAYVCLIMLCSGHVFASDSVEKCVCLSLLNQQFSDVRNIRQELLLMAKREAAAELFGEYICSFSKSSNFVLKVDEIKAYSVGIIRLKGSPRYHNGEDFGEVCVTVTGYIQNSDKRLFRLHTLRKEFILSEPQLELGKIREEARRTAMIEALREYDGRLRDVAPASLLKLVRNASFSNEGFVSGTTAFRTNFSGEVLPIEVKIIAECSGQDISELFGTKAKRFMERVKSLFE